MRELPKSKKSMVLEIICVLLFVFGWGIGGTALWWVTGNYSWLGGWVITMIIVAAGGL